MAEEIRPAAVTVQRVKSAEKWVAKQIRNITAVGETNYREGVVSPKRAIVATSIAKEPKFASKMREVIEKKSRVAGLKGITDDFVVGSAIEIGAPILVSAVTKRKGKIDKFVGGFQPLLSALESDIDKLGDVTDAEREARMLENLRGLKARKLAWKK